MKVWRDHYTPGGGSPDAALNLESMSGYESGFPIGARLSREEKKNVVESLEGVEHVLTLLRINYYGAYSAISLAYFLHNADPSMVDDRRKKAGLSESARRFVIDHDRGVEDINSFQLADGADHFPLKIQTTGSSRHSARL